MACGNGYGDGNKSRLLGSGMLNSDEHTSYYGGNSIRPIVTLGPDIEITLVDYPNGNSTENMHQISKK